MVGVSVVVAGFDGENSMFILSAGIGVSARSADMVMWVRWMMKNRRMM